MFTRRLLFGYAGTGLLSAGIPLIIGFIASSATTLGFDAFTDGLIAALVLGALTAGLLGLSVRGGRRPTILIPIGYTLLLAYAAAIAWFIALKLVPGLVMDRSMAILANIGGVFILFMSPAAFWVWRMVRDPALH